MLKTAGDTVLVGTSNNDKLSGGEGNDLIHGGLGNDVLTGGDGADVFKFESPKDPAMAYKDRITDFNQAEGDKIDLSKVIGEDRGIPSMLTKNQISFSGSEVKINFNPGQLYISGEPDTGGDFKILIPGLKSITIDMFIL